MDLKRLVQVFAVVLMMGIVSIQGNIGQKIVQEEATAEELFDPWSVQKTCVRIQTDGHYGSGSIYEITEEQIIIVTNRHVLEYWNEESYVTFFNGADCSGGTLELSDEADIGFLSVSCTNLSREKLQELHKIKITDAILGKGEYFYMIDMASDVYDKKLYEGQILEPELYLEEFGMKMLYGEACFVPGMSGCGVFDMQGNYIGMLTGGTDQNEIAAVPARLIFGK